MCFCFYTDSDCNHVSPEKPSKKRKSQDERECDLDTGPVKKSRLDNDTTSPSELSSVAGKESDAAKDSTATKAKGENCDASHDKCDIKKSEEVCTGSLNLVTCN